MPRFYFDVDRDGGAEPDTHGTELAHQDLIPKMALDLALQIAREAMPSMVSIIISVREGVGEPLFRASLSLEGAWQR